MTVIVIEHEVEVMAKYADRVIVIEHGRVVMNGTPAEIFSQVDKLTEMGLRAPEAAVLAEILRGEGLWTGPTPTTTEPAVAAVRKLIGASRG
jgi:ABC-type glutathione transport system ATPase component